MLCHLLPPSHGGLCSGSRDEHVASCQVRGTAQLHACTTQLAYHGLSTHACLLAGSGSSPLMLLQRHPWLLCRPLTLTPLVPAWRSALTAACQEPCHLQWKVRPHAAANSALVLCAFPSPCRYFFSELYRTAMLYLLVLHWVCGVVRQVLHHTPATTAHADKSQHLRILE